jgi:hypothetical protein
LFKFGNDPLQCQQFHEEKKAKKGETLTDEEQVHNDVKRFKCTSLNCVKELFQITYGERSMYLLIDRNKISEKIANKYFDIKLMLKDYVLTKDDENAYQKHSANYENLENEVTMNQPVSGAAHLKKIPWY